jgi:hypothetical protein
MKMAKTSMPEEIGVVIGDLANFMRSDSVGTASMFSGGDRSSETRNTCRTATGGGWSTLPCEMRGCTTLPSCRTLPNWMTLPDTRLRMNSSNVPKWRTLPDTRQRMNSSNVIVERIGPHSSMFRSRREDKGLSKEKAVISRAVKDNGIRVSSAMTKTDKRTGTVGGNMSGARVTSQLDHSAMRGDDRRRNLDGIVAMDKGIAQPIWNLEKTLMRRRISDVVGNAKHYLGEELATKPQGLKEIGRRRIGTTIHVTATMGIQTQAEDIMIDIRGTARFLTTKLAKTV